jgi:hypothetical protein
LVLKNPKENVHPSRKIGQKRPIKGMKEKQVAERGNVPGELGHQRRHNN